MVQKIKLKTANPESHYTANSDCLIVVVPISPIPKQLAQQPPGGLKVIKAYLFGSRDWFGAGRPLPPIFIISDRHDSFAPMRFLLIALILTGLFLFLRWQYRQSPRQLYQWLASAIGIGLIALVLAGRAHWIVAMVGGILPFLGKAALLVRWLPFLSRLYRTHGSSGIHLQTAWLEVEINRSTGAMDGTVRQGEYQGRRLSQLDLSQLERLLHACQNDQQSAALLCTYIQRTHSNWRDEKPGGEASTDDFEDSTLSAETAAQILGVSLQTSDDEIRAAHRNLAQKLHPDRGGNDYLTRKINKARDVLIKKSKER